MLREYDGHANHKCEISMSSVLVSLGSNVAGAWGTPRQALLRATREIEAIVGSSARTSPLYVTAPVGPVRQQAFLNSVLLIQVNQPVSRLLRLFKLLEREAGRRPATGVRWGPRPLDIDIIDHAGRVSGWRRIESKTGRPGREPVHLILPHPRAHARRFVLRPVLDVQPHWWHPALRQPGRRLLHRLGDGRTVRRA